MASAHDFFSGPWLLSIKNFFMISGFGFCTLNVLFYGNAGKQIMLIILLLGLLYISQINEHTSACLLLLSMVARFYFNAFDDISDLGCGFFYEFQNGKRIDSIIFSVHHEPC